MIDKKYKHWVVVGYLKADKSIKKHITGFLSSEDKALNFCESWGWSYDDGQKSYWLDYELIEF